MDTAYIQVDQFAKIIEKPYEDKKEIDEYQSPAPLSDKIYKTFCGT